MVGAGPYGLILDDLADDWRGTVKTLARMQGGAARGVLSHPDVPGR